MLQFEVEGVPAPQGSKKAVPHRTTGRVMMIDVNSPALKAWRRLVSLKATNALAWNPSPELREGGLAVEVVFFLPRPKSHRRTGRNAHLLRADAPEFPGKPDLDKLVRAVFDALTDVVWTDDSQVVSVQASKVFADGFEPGAYVTVDRLDTPDSVTEPAPTLAAVT
jgi:Holliday junction resolvase RusA-like endonuclease